MNLLAKSGLTDNRIERDLNLLRTAVIEASRHLNEDELKPALNRHFGLENIKEEKLKKQADGCVIAALLMMNAAMLHQRIANDGKWMPDIDDLETVKNSANVISAATRQWNAIIGHDFKPILEPAVKVIYAIEDTGKLTGLERALRHLAGEAERIAEAYADMGAEHAGLLFNKVMGNRASDGAFFTRPEAAAMAARLTCNLMEENYAARQSKPSKIAKTSSANPKTDSGNGKSDCVAAKNQGRPINWASKQFWKSQRIVDFACGSGILLVAMLREMKRRAALCGAKEALLASLHKIAVEEVLKGLDINEISLQLAATALCADAGGKIDFEKMGLHRMPYGPQKNGEVKAGALELLSQKEIVARKDELGLPDEEIASQQTWPQNRQLAQIASEVNRASVVIMNPPFTNRVKMGEKFKDIFRDKLRKQVDGLETILVENDAELEKFRDKNALAPLFIALSEKGMNQNDGCFAFFRPTISTSSLAGLKERQTLAKRFRVDSILTVHQPGNNTLSQDVAINESIILLSRFKSGEPTRFINLDKFPQIRYSRDDELQDFFACLEKCESGQIGNGWGEISFWPRERIERGDWTPAIWRSPELAEAAAQFSEEESLKTLAEMELKIWAVGMLARVVCERANQHDFGSFPLIKASSEDAQTAIESKPDQWWIHKKRDKRETEKLLAKAGHLLITSGQDNRTGRMAAVASDTKYIGSAWLPISNLTADEAKALAVFLNSTAGRMQLLRNMGRKQDYPQYNTSEIANIRVPDVRLDWEKRGILLDCWEKTRGMRVPQYRDGDSGISAKTGEPSGCCGEVRVLWDAAVSQAMLAFIDRKEREAKASGGGFAKKAENDFEKTRAGENGGIDFAAMRERWRLSRLNHLRQLLHREPHIRGKPYSQFADAKEEDD